MLIAFAVLLVLLWLIGLLSGLHLGMGLHALVLLALAAVAFSVVRRLGRRGEGA